MKALNLFYVSFSHVGCYGDSLCVCANFVVHVDSLPNDRVCMGSNKFLLVLLYHVLYAALLPIPWNDDGVTHPKHPSGVHINISVLQHTRSHGWLHCACSSKSFHPLTGIVCSIPFVDVCKFVIHCIIGFASEGNSGKFSTFYCT